MAWRKIVEKLLVIKMFFGKSEYPKGLTRSFMAEKNEFARAARANADIWLEQAIVKAAKLTSLEDCSRPFYCIAALMCENAV